MRIKHVGLLIVGVVFVTMFSKTATACRVICFHLNTGTECYEFEGNCPASCDNCDCYQGAMFPPSAYLVAVNGHAYLSEDGKNTNIAGDKLAAFVVQMERTFPAGKKLSAVEESRRTEQYRSFFRSYKKASDTVSKARLTRIASESKLKVLSRDPNSK